MNSDFGFLSASLQDLALALVTGLVLFTILYTAQRQRLWISLLGILALGLILSLYSHTQLVSRYAEQQQDAMAQAVRQTGERLDNVLEARLVEVNALTAYLGEPPAPTAQAYRHFLDRLLTSPELYTNLAAAPDLRIQYIYPRAGNESVLGTYYPDVPQQWPEIQRAIELRQSALTGPIDLIQGGRGFIIQQPVFQDDDSLWGVVAAVLPLTDLLQSSGLTALAEAYQVRVARVATDESPEQLVWHSGSTPVSSWVREFIAVPNGLWEIRIEPRQAISLPTPIIMTLNALTVLLTLTALLITYLTARWRQRQQENQNRLLLSHRLLDEAQRIGGLGSWQARPGDATCYLSSQLQTILGKPEAMTLDTWPLLAAPDERDGLRQQLDRLRSGEQDTLSTEHSVWTPHGQRCVAHSAAWLEPAGPGEKSVIMGTVLDITQQKKNEEALQRLAYLDPLTDIPNRSGFQKTFSNLLQQHRSTGQRMALLHIDLDDFKDINDANGHQVGDAILRLCSRRIRDALPDTAPLGRIGGDEFMAVLPAVDSIEDVRALAGRLITLLSRPVCHKGEEVLPSACIGIALYPEDASGFDSMYQCADLALYQAKHAGSGQYCFYQPIFQVRFEYRTRLEAALKQALAGNEFWLTYQPRYHLKTGQITGVEALLRWQSHTLGQVSPGEFIPLAEQRGLIGPIGAWVLQQACGEFQRIRRFLPAQSRLAINLSARQIQDPGLAKQILSILKSAGLTPADLELEITETFLLEDINTCRYFMHELAATGITFSMDDFGTGYSNLVTLQQLPLRTLKIDKSFVLEQDLASGLPLAKTVVQMGHSMGLTVVAEGVENATTEAILANINCDEVQGFHLARPMTEAELIQFLRNPSCNRN